jgi:hypothetical protein
MIQERFQLGTFFSYFPTTKWWDQLRHPFSFTSLYPDDHQLKLHWTFEDPHTGYLWLFTLQLEKPEDNPFSFNTTFTQQTPDHHTYRDMYPQPWLASFA